MRRKLQGTSHVDGGSKQQRKMDKKMQLKDHCQFFLKVSLDKVRMQVECPCRKLHYSFRTCFCCSLWLFWAAGVAHVVPGGYSGLLE
jgi:hypothetical protein